MRILHINAIHEEKSTGRICKEISSVAVAHGHESVVAYATGPDTGSGFRIGSSFDQKRHALLSRLSGKQGYFSKGATAELIDYIESYKPDIVHLHNLHANYIHLETLFNWLSQTDTPTVLTLHDCWFYTGKCTHYTRTGCARWRDGCGSCPRLALDNPSWGLDRTADMWTDKKRWFENIQWLAVIGVSDWITMEARFSFLGNAKLIRRIYNWVDLNIFYPRDTSGLRAALGLEHRFVLLGVASSWDDSKGLSDFLQVAQALPEDRFLLVGDLPELTLPVNVIHIPSTNRIEELADYYALADAFLNLSVEESFGKVTAEAMASGTPVVVLDATANPELVPITCGEVVQPHQLEAVIDAIEKMRRRGKEYYEDACIEHARASFSMEERVMDYLHVYESLVHDKRRNSAWNVPSSQSSSPSTMERTI
ncbi:glycosyltransferase [Exiguobacterium sp. SL-9]|uniref:glycosyltransferase n=1 Tax=Exiguobacterium sp. SL-9 TaxID=2510963 RepID=UPI00103B2E5A|nr:glycosyltransferase [Exiguobacterium sp. SL-9]TCI22602.1 glycosyltransferase [Exiguobacterium sp. SL-9]